MTAIANPRLHIICGVCGNKDMLSFEVDPEDCIAIPNAPSVLVRCGNCNTLTDLAEEIDQVVTDQPRTVQS